MIGVSTEEEKPTHFPRANPLLIKDFKEERMKRGNVEEEEGVNSDRLIQSQKRHLQSLLPPIRDTKIGRGKKALIGVAL